MNASSEYLHCYWHILLPLFAADSVRRSSRSSGNGPISSQPWHLSNHTVKKKCKLSLPRNTRAASIRPQSETSRVRKAINMSRETRTGEMLGRVAAAEEVARRLRLPELLPTLAPAALQTSTDSTKSPTQFPPEQRKGFANRTRNSALTGTVKSTAPITLLATSAGFFNCSVKQKGGERNRNPRQARSRTRSAATNTI